MPNGKPLTGVRVVDLSRILAGPWATQMLADLGAEVIKVEHPLRGDDTRAWGPPFAEAEEGSVRESAYFIAANRGKKSVAIDLKSPEGAALVQDLATNADVFIENFKQGDLGRYGLDADALRARNPGLIYCSITGFGQSGPRSGQAGYDLMIQALGGLMSITGQPDGDPGGEPMKVGVALIDVLTGLHAAIGILAALRERDETGRGRTIDLALFDVCAASLANQAMNYLVSGRVPDRMGNKHPNIAPYEVFQAQDGFIVLAVGNDSQFRNFCTITGLHELPSDARFETNSARVQNRVELLQILTPVLGSKAREVWLAELEAAGVPCGPINRVDEVFNDPQAKARNLVQELPHQTLGCAPAVANPLRFDGESMTSDSASPILGQHSHAALATILGIDEQRLRQLREKGVVHQAPALREH